MSLEIANTIRKQLVGMGQMKVWSWGANSWTGGKDFLMFKVQGFKFKGIVKITLKFDDTYTIEFLKGRKQELVKSIEGVYFDEMTDIIDRYVEKSGSDEEYSKLVKSAKYNF